MLSGETKNFSFKFKSNAPGVFMENWELALAPALPDHKHMSRLSVKAVVTFDDTIQRLTKQASEQAIFNTKLLYTTSCCVSHMFKPIVNPRYEIVGENWFLKCGDLTEN